MDAFFRCNAITLRPHLPLLLPNGFKPTSPESQYDVPAAPIRYPTAVGAAFKDGCAFLELARATLALAAKLHKSVKEIGRWAFLSGIRK
uniref:Uncharacterized protein n=1 Tax=Cucumis melo TaxID=3656 RepID=A0A9I9DQ74_CUCME